MEPISIRELVAWVLVLGLGVILVSSKMKANSMSSKPSVKKASKPAKSVKPSEPGNVEKAGLEFIETPIAGQAPEEARTDGDSLDGVSKQSIRSGEGRRGSDQVPGLDDRIAKMRNRKIKHGSAPRSRKSRKTTVRSEQDGVVDKGVS
jgi:hypothetical protein